MGVLIDSRGIIRHNGDATVQIDCPITASGITVGAGEIGTTELATGAVTAIKVGAEAIETAGIKDLNVTTGKLAAGAVTVTKLGAGAVTLPKMDLFTGLKVLAADGVDSSGGDQQVTLTGTVIGDRVVAIFGQIKAETGANSFLVPTIPTHFEGTITVTNKIIQKTAAGHLEANTYLFLIVPAAA